MLLAEWKGCRQSDVVEVSIERPFIFWLPDFTKAGWGQLRQ